jgi:rhamnosyltransferase
MNSVCAVIVTFRPKADALENLAKVRPQVQGLVVVDNGSSAEALAPFRAAIGDLDFTLIENGENLGIATALNIGVRWAQSKDYEFVALFDQDSTVSEGFIETMLSKYRSQIEPDIYAIVTPTYANRTTGEVKVLYYMKDGNFLPMTSGSLIPIRVFSSIGWFEEDFIIDYVDVDFALRALALGYSTLLAREAILWHTVGSPRKHTILRVKSVTTTHHAPARRYYMTRNRLVVIIRYGRQYPRFCSDVLITMFKQTIKAFMLEENRFQILLNTARGVLDAFRLRMGKVVEL